MNNLINEFPEVAGNFDIKYKIGAGTFGTVYVASLKLNSDRWFALKHISSCYHHKVESEIKCLCLMKDSEHIITLETFIHHNDHIVLVMPFFKHDAFTEYFNRMIVTEVQHYTKSLFLALEALHNHHIIHRDIKPSNFLYNYKDKKFKLIDLGLAHHVCNGLPSQTGSCSLPVQPSISFNLGNRKMCRALNPFKGSICDHEMSEICDICYSKPSQYSPRAGTSGFRAPEVLLKYQNQTTAVDMWSAGVVFLCILSGKYPFFKAPDDMTAMMQISSLFGSQECIKAAKRIGKDLLFLPFHRTQNLAKVCIQLKHGMQAVSNEKSDSCVKGCKSCVHSYNMLESNSTSCFTENTWTAAPSTAYDLLQKCLDLNPLSRITAREALNHPFLQNNI